MSAIPTVKVASPILTDATLLAEPNLRAVADDVLAKLRYAFTAAAAQERPAAAAGSIDKLFREFLATRSAPTRARAQEKARALLKAAPQLRREHFGRYAAIDVKDFAALGSDGIDSRVGALKVDSAALKKSLNKLHARLTVRPSEDDKVKIPPIKNDTPGKSMDDIDADASNGLRFKKLQLYIRKVRCRVETNELSDSDEINLGGIIVGATGNTVLVNQFKVSHDFDAGEVKDFGFNRVFGTWKLRTSAAGFPYVYTAVIAMAEKDDGGFGDFLKGLFEGIVEIVGTMLGGAIGAAIGAALGSLGGPILMLVGGLIGGIIGWIVGMLKDDIVGVHTLQMGLGSYRKSYYDWAKLTSAQGAQGTLTFKGDGGRYEVDYTWKVAT